MDTVTKVENTKTPAGDKPAKPMKIADSGGLEVSPVGMFGQDSRMTWHVPYNAHGLLCVYTQVLPPVFETFKLCISSYIYAVFP